MPYIAGLALRVGTGGGAFRRRRDARAGPARPAGKDASGDDSARAGQRPRWPAAAEYAEHLDTMKELHRLQPLPHLLGCGIHKLLRKHNLEQAQPAKGFQNLCTRAAETQHATRPWGCDREERRLLPHRNTRRMEPASGGTRHSLSVSGEVTPPVSTLQLDRPPAPRDPAAWCLCMAPNHLGGALRAGDEGRAAGIATSLDDADRLARRWRGIVAEATGRAARPAGIRHTRDGSEAIVVG